MADNMTDREWMLWVGVYVRALPTSLARMDLSSRRSAMNSAEWDANLTIEHLRDKAQKTAIDITSPKGDDDV